MLWIEIDDTNVVMHNRRIVFRLSKHDGITHAVWLVLHQFKDNTHTDTLCRQPLNVPWRNTSRFSRHRVDCMSCLVRMSRLTY